MLESLTIVLFFTLKKVSILSQVLLFFYVIELIFGNCVLFILMKLKKRDVKVDQWNAERSENYFAKVGTLHPVALLLKDCLNCYVHIQYCLS